MGTHGYNGVYMGIKDYTRVLRVHMGIHGYSGVYMGMKGCTWV